MGEWAAGRTRRGGSVVWLSLAEPEGYVRTFVDEGKPMAYLLSMMLDP